MRRANQLVFTLEQSTRWGGRRNGAGRKPSARPPVPHGSRPRFGHLRPAHVTVKVRPDVPSLRSVRLVREIEGSFATGRERGDFRLVHYSLQSNHAHLVVEAADQHALGRGMKSLGSRLARAVNRTFGRHGPVLEGRYHLRLLRTPREVRNVLRYVLLSARKHLGRGQDGKARPIPKTALDPASSARWFDGWATSPGGPLASRVRRPVAVARTWLLRVGWRRHGLIDPHDVPG